MSIVGFRFYGNRMVPMLKSNNYVFNVMFPAFVSAIYLLNIVANI